MNRIEVMLPFVLYMIVMTGAGVYFYRVTKTREDFHLGGRSLNSWVVGFSHAFSGMSGWMLIAYTGMAYTMGPSLFWMMTSYLVAIFLQYTFLAPRLRNYSELVGAMTYAEYFSKRIRDNTNLVRLIGTFATVVFMAAYVGSQFVAGAKTAAPLLGISYETALVLTAVAVTVYCLAGGLTAVCWSDYVRGWIIIIVTIVTMFVLLIKAGGWASAINQIGSVNPNLVNVGMGKAGAALVGAVLAQVSLALGTCGRPHDTVRFFTIEGSDKLLQTRVIGMFGFAVPYFTCFMIGYLGRVFYPALKDAEAIMPTLMLEVFNPWWSGIVLTTILMLIMTTVDSQLVSAASSIVEDFYRPVVNKNASEKLLMKLSRVAVILVALGGIYIAITSPETVFWLTIYAGNGLAATFAPVLILSLYWKRLTKWGTAASMLGGFLTILIWRGSPWRPIVNEIVPGYVVAFTLAIIVSLLTTQPYQGEIEEELTLVAKPLPRGKLAERMATMVH